MLSQVVRIPALARGIVQPRCSQTAGGSAGAAQTHARAGDDDNASEVRVDAAEPCGP